MRCLIPALINRNVTSLILTLLVAACGGGGGDRGTNPSYTQGSVGAERQPPASPPEQPASGLQPVPGNPSSAIGAGVARFNYPAGIAVAANGDLYVVDSGNHAIRRITASGVVSTVAGLPGIPGSLDGTGVAARFNRPHGITLDRNGNLYVTDTGNHTVRKISPAGVVTTFAGTAGIIGSIDAAGAAASFYLPTGITSDGLGNIYVADTENFLIRRITPTGSVSTLAGIRGVKGIRDGDVATASFANPLGLTANVAGDLFITDGHLSAPAPGSIAGSMIVRRIGTGGMITAYAGTLYTETGNTYVDGPGTAARFYFAYGLAADEAGNLYVADSGNNAIRRVTPSRVVNTLVGSAGQLNSPRGIALGTAGDIYFTDSANHVIRRLTPSGQLSIVAGTPGAQGFADTP